MQVQASGVSESGQPLPVRGQRHLDHRVRPDGCAVLSSVGKVHDPLDSAGLWPYPHVLTVSAAHQHKAAERVGIHHAVERPVVPRRHRHMLEGGGADGTHQ